MLKVRRVLASLIDWYIAYIIIFIVFCPLRYLVLRDNINLDNFILLVDIVWVCLIRFKDWIFKNGSIGKKIMNIEILTSDNQNPSKIILYFRNVFTILFPIEIVMIILFNKRLGDIVFRTKVVYKSNKNV